ncbi:Ig-like domain-containing protein, partial [Salmonella enterica]|uniref:Ig-like domain-containing protein n=1 Tax=Salmonella enterica TaxID=28901 RepID=UPI000A183F59
FSLPSPVFFFFFFFFLLFIDTLLSEPTIALDSTDDSGTKGDNLTNVNKPTFILGNIDADARYVTVEVQHGGTK